jgi:ERCC4-related helicase
MVSKAFKSTKKLTFEDSQYSLEDFLPQFSQVKVTVKELNETIDKFKKNFVNVLIATSVIEEGLDISTCNLVISINEILTVKSFI